jgi:phenylacetate-coenzyme A ligase PaaK-like adenylate-forming protein
MTEISIPETFQSRPFARAHFSRIARWALAHHPFYRKLAIEPGHAFPILTRSRVQDDNELLLNGFEATGRTSGSTSMPVEISWSPQRARQDRRDIAQYVRWLGGPLPNMRIIALSAHEKDEKTIDVIDPIPTQIDFMLRRHQIDGACSLVTYPTNLEMLCRYVIENGIDMSFLRRCICLSEAYEPYHDELLRQAFPNAVASCSYSSVELGLIAARCPHRPDNYHIMAHKLGVEFLNEDGLPCRDGEVGQVVVTDYGNRRSTLIRYALGDLAAPAVCGCGKIALPAMTQVIGKVRGVLKDRSGRPVMFTGISPMFRDSPEIRQFQVIQTALDHFQVRYVPRAEVPVLPFLNRVRTRFEVEFGAAARVDFEVLDEIPRGPGGKFHGAICLV